MTDYPSEKEILLGQTRLEYHLNKFQMGGTAPFHPALMEGLSGEQFAELARCMMESKVWGKDEEPDTSAMFGSYRKWNENPRWNVGFIGSIWMDVNLCGEDIRIAFYHRSDDEGVFTCDELMGNTVSLTHRKGGSNFTPKKKKRKK